MKGQSWLEVLIYISSPEVVMCHVAEPITQSDTQRDL